MRFREAFDPIRAITATVRHLDRRPLVIIVGALLLAVSQTSMSLTVEAVMPGVEIAIACGCAIAGVFGFFLYCVLFPGLATAIERVALQGEERIEDLFRSRGRWLNMVLVSLLVFLLTAVAVAPVFVAALIGGAIGGGIGDEFLAVGFAWFAGLAVLPVTIYVLLGLALAPYAVAIERKGPFAAVARGWRLVRGNRLWFLLWQIVMGLLSAIGFCLCCVGIFATTGLTLAASHEAYLRLVRDDQDRWADAGGDGAPLGSVLEEPGL